MNTKRALIFSLLLFAVCTAQGSTFYWIASGGGNWNNAANWSTSSGGSGGAGIPDNDDIVYFDRGGSCILTANVTIISLYLQTGFNATINAGSNTLTITGEGTFNTGTISGTGSLNFNNTTAQITFKGTTFSIPISGTSGNILFSGSTFNNSVTLTKTNTGFDNGTGGNTFKAAVSLTSQKGSLLLGTTTASDIFDGPLTLTISSTGFIQVGQRSTANQYNNNITVNSTGSGYIAFGSNYTGTLGTLADGKTIKAGTFSRGSLLLYYFTQAGTTAQSITLTGSAILSIGSLSPLSAGCTFNGAVTCAAPQVSVSSSTFNQTASFTSTAPVASSIQSCGGGNTFNDNASFINNSGAEWKLGQYAGDTFKKNALYQDRNGFGVKPMGLAYTNTYAGDITSNSNTPSISFEGTAEFIGTADQQITSTSGGSSPVFNNLTINNTGGTLNLKLPIQITGLLNFTSGKIIAATTAPVLFVAGSSHSHASNTSHVEGPVKKVGNTAFTFPVGKGGVYRPISMSNPGTVTDVFTAEFFRTGQSFGSTLAFPMTLISRCEYWLLDRSVGTSNVNVSLSWTSADCPRTYVNTPADLVVSSWNGLQWVNHGNGSMTGNAASGAITSATAVSAFRTSPSSTPFALGTISPNNPLPVTFTDITASAVAKQVHVSWTTATEQNTIQFDIERSADGIQYTTLGHVAAEGNNGTGSDYTFLDEKPLTGRAYYRIKTIDRDGHIGYSRLSMVMVDDSTLTPLNAYPNPARDFAVIDLQGQTLIRHRIINTQGSTMSIPSRVENNLLHLDTSSLMQGIYVVEIIAGDHVQKLRMIVE